MLKTLLKKSTNLNCNFTQHFCWLSNFRLLTCRQLMKITRCLHRSMSDRKNWNRNDNIPIRHFTSWSVKPPNRPRRKTRSLTLHLAIHGVPAMEFNAIWWDFLHVPLCTTHIQHELNRSNQLLVRRVPFSIFAVVSCCWNGECDSDIFAMCTVECWAELSGVCLYTACMQTRRMQYIASQFICNQFYMEMIVDIIRHSWTEKKTRNFHAETIKF